MQLGNYTLPYYPSREISNHALSLKDFLLMFFLLALSGNPFFTQNLPEIATIGFIVPLVYILKHSNGFITYKTLFIFTFFIGYELLHSLLFDLDYSLTLIKQFLVLLIAYSIVHILKNRFINVLVRTMYIICIISFIFTILCYIPGINSFLYSWAIKLFPLQVDFNNFSTPTLLLYTFHPDIFDDKFSYVRNAGIFWEAGAFAVYLNITLYLYYSKKEINDIKDLFDKKSIVFIVALISTTSTMGFLALTLILSFFTIQLRSNLKYLLFVCILISVFVAFQQVDYLGEKIVSQLASSQTSNNRFGSALMDLEDIQERPILGWSRRIEVLFGTTEFSPETHRPNGLTNFIRNYGILYFTVYFYFVFLSFKNVGDRNNSFKNKSLVAIFGVLLLWTVSFSESIFDFAFLKSLIFLAMVYNPAFDNNLLKNQEKPITGKVRG